MAALAGLAAPMPAPAAAAGCTIPSVLAVPRPVRPPRGDPPVLVPVTGYVLALSWSPQFCADRDPRRDLDSASQCARPGAFGWILHGLWPDGAGPGGQYPRWCRPARIVPQAVIRQQFCATPSEQLIQRQWAKHGTCMSPYPSAYFRAARILFGAVRLPDMARLAAGPTRAGDVRARDVRRAFAAANPGLGPDMVAVFAGGGGALREVRLCLDARMRPANCAPSRRGVGDQRRLVVRPRD